MDEMHQDACDHSADSTPGCEDGTGRRTFLKEGLMALAALTALGATASNLHALTREYATGHADGATVRYPVPAADGVTIDSENKVMIARFAGSIYAFGLECPHRGADVTWQARQNRFYCPKHKSTFQPGGTFIEGKAERGLDRYAITREGDEIVVDTAVLIREPDAAAHAAAKVAA
jgi:nitrite reductase/ring-hydroxylating ferredoxin subunit